MKKALANQIAKLWNENFAGSTEATLTEAVVKEYGREKDCTVLIIPKGAWNTGETFYHVEHLADVRRAFKVSCYVTIDNGKCVAHIHA